jgi:alpha-tubulin suppressor-like RCC1 family protein
MKTIVNLRRRHYLARISTFLIMAALIAGMAGCVGVNYDLTIASTAGGWVTTPEHGTSAYGEGEVVNLVAEAEEGYRFVNWTGDVNTVDDVNDAITTITMDDKYSITANFEAIPATQYTLTISSTAGGSVTTPGEGTFTYGEGMEVLLVAEAEESYRFVNWTGDVSPIDQVDDATTITMRDNYSIVANFGYTSMVSPGWHHTVGLKTDGTVVAVGDNSYGQRDVDDWTGIVQVAAGWDFTVGLKSDATVVAVGRNSYGQCDVDNWTGIVQVDAGAYHTVGLKSDGTVVAVGRNFYGECDVDNWTGITQVAAGYGHTVGLKSNGTVVAVGDNYFGQCDVDGWADIVQVAVGYFHTVGLKSDGTVVAVGPEGAEGWPGYGQCEVGDWMHIARVAAGYFHTVGLKSDGTVVAVGPSYWSQHYYGQCNVGSWTNITQVAAGKFHTVGAKSDGTVVAEGLNRSGQCNVGDWDLT